MGKIIALHRYRKRKQKNWLEENQNRIYLFIGSFLIQSQQLSDFFETTTLQQSHSEINSQIHSDELSWNPEHIRDLLHEYVTSHNISEIYEALCTEKWFKPEHAPKNLILEMTLQFYMTKLVS